MQFGDSHTAADMFTGEARARMQARFGDGGIGYSYAGHPFAGYRILGSGRGQSGSWQTLGTHFTQLGDAELGLGGVAIQSSHAGDTASLDVPCRTLQVQFLRQPGGGGFQLADNGTALTAVSTSSSAVNDETGEATSPTAQRRAQEMESLPPGAGTSSLPVSAPTGMSPYTADRALANGQSGTAQDAYSARASRAAYFGYPATPPAGAGSPAATPPETPGLSLQNRNVDGSTTGTASLAGTLREDCASGPHHFVVTTLGGGPVRLLGTVALQPGTTWESIGINGAEAPLLLRWNQGIFRTYLAEANPDLIVLAYGTNEAAAHWSGEKYRETFASLLDMLHRTVPASSILVVGPADRSLGSTTYTVTGRGRRARRIAHRYYAPYAGTARIVDAQREVCSTHNCAFWDWQARQGGLGAMNRWVSAGYAQPDHTHFTATGYRALADALVADLLSAYSGFKN